jgi:hypothetical protein
MRFECPSDDFQTLTKINKQDEVGWIHTFLFTFPWESIKKEHSSFVLFFSSSPSSALFFLWPCSLLSPVLLSSFPGLALLHPFPLASLSMALLASKQDNPRWIPFLLVALFAQFPTPIAFLGLVKNNLDVSKANTLLIFVSLLH